MLRQLGPVSRYEWIVLVVFISTCVSWMLGGFLFGPKSITVIALLSVSVLLISGVISWLDVIREKGAWDVFLWYGGLVQLGNLLRRTNVPQTVAQTLAEYLSPLPVFLLFLAVLLIYFYAHYAFASITSHIVSMYGAFVSLLIVAGVPAPLAACALAFITNLSAGLTHYGTTHGPILFSVGYVSAGTWWKLGFWISIANLTIWLSVGLVWWKICGLW
jgi:DASS family divalent anion:Na+ symporter